MLRANVSGELTDNTERSHTKCISCIQMPYILAQKMLACCQFITQCSTTHVVNSLKQFHVKNGCIYTIHGDWWDCLYMSKMAILCLCSEVHKASVISQSTIFIPCRRITVVEILLYQGRFTVLANSYINRRKLVWTEQKPSATKQPDSLWTVTERPLKALVPWQRVSTKGKCS